MKSKKELDKFYTHPDIAKKFVEHIEKFVDLKSFDLILEPSAGSGNILCFLPEKAIGLDLEPEGKNILQQDFFKYVSPYDPLSNNIRIATVGNPPFGSGYMNPLAKRFFNHAAEFSEVIAFIVPAKWHTSWKVQKGLNEDFGLYFSEILPRNSFLFNDVIYDVNCCMQIWSKTSLGTNLRIIKAPPTKHEDFDMFLMCDNVARRKIVQEQIRNQVYWEFGLKYWGNIKICEIETISDTSTTHYVFAPRKPYVRSIFESIDWKDYVSNMGAPNVGGKSLIVNAYTKAKEKLGL
jgi:predicted RNA methylase